MKATMNITEEEIIKPYLRNIQNVLLSQDLSADDMCKIINTYICSILTNKEKRIDETFY